MKKYMKKTDTLNNVWIFWKYIYSKETQTADPHKKELAKIFTCLGGIYFKSISDCPINYHKNFWKDTGGITFHYQIRKD